MGEKTAQERVAELLERLANGETVVLGEFGDNAVSTDADEDACVLRELADHVRVAPQP
jgi:hypothetical protein